MKNGKMVSMCTGSSLASTELNTCKGNIIKLILAYSGENKVYVDDLVAYYASALSFLGTIILGMLTLHQNKRAQEKTDEINKLELEMQKKSMELAEKQYRQGTETTIPKFEVKISSCNGHYLNPRITIKNVSSMLISDLTVISAFVRDEQGNTVRKVTDHRIKNRSLASNEGTIIDLKC